MTGAVKLLSLLANLLSDYPLLVWLLVVGIYTLGPTLQLVVAPWCNALIALFLIWLTVCKLKQSLLHLVLLILRLLYDIFMT